MQVDETATKLAGMTIQESTTSAAADSQADSSEAAVKSDAPTVFIVMGMAGSGKTTFVHVSLLLHKMSKCMHELTLFCLLLLASDLSLEPARQAHLHDELGPCRP